MKLNEMREKTVEELQSAIIDWKKDLFNYKLQLIAQAKTVINEKGSTVQAQCGVEVAFAKEKNNMPKKEKQGVVISSKMDKTIVVKVADYEPHPKYKKIMESNKNYKAHDPENICNEGDIVRIVEARPTSKDKRWALAEVVEKAR